MAAKRKRSLPSHHCKSSRVVAVQPTMLDHDESNKKYFQQIGRLQTLEREPKTEFSIFDFKERKGWGVGELGQGGMGHLKQIATGHVLHDDTKAVVL